MINYFTSQTCNKKWIIYSCKHLKRAFSWCIICCQTIRQTKSDSGPPNYCRMQWYIQKRIDDHFIASEIGKIQKWIMHTQNSLERSFLNVYNILPNHQTDKNWFWTSWLLQNALICKNDGWSFFHRQNFKLTSELCTLRNPLKKLPNHQRDKKWFRTPGYCRMRWYAKKDEWSFFHKWILKYTSKLCTIRNRLKRAF